MQKLLFLGLASFALAAGQNRVEQGRDIAQRAQAVHFAYSTLRASGEMTLRRGAEVLGQRSIVVEQIEHESGDAYDKARITITAPAALKDTQLLSWSKGKGDDQQWLVTPHTRRVQRIADRGRQAAFVSSDFAYEDILKWQLDNYEYTRVDDGRCPSGTCAVVDTKPLSRYSGYALLKVYFDEIFRITQIDYFIDRSDRPRKTLVQRSHVLYGRTWQPSSSVMTDHQKGTSTEIAWSGYMVDVPLDERSIAPSGIAR
jgi:hypothetical protein